MSNNSRYRTLVDQFRARSEENYIFACQASVPLLLTRDLLYQLWNNFKRYQYEFNSQQTFKISHIAISDLLLSPLCREVGHELYEIPKEARDLLFEELVLNLGEKRKNTIAAFLEEYALLEQHFSRRKRLKSIHLLTALSILDPHEMEKQIIVQINEAKTDQEKLNLLMLHRNLVPLGFESDLGKISTAVAGADQSFSPILIAEEDAQAPGVLNVTLPVALRSRVRRTKRLQETGGPVGNLKALELIMKCIAEGGTELDLGRLGLTDADFVEHSPIDVALRQCTELRTLVLSNEWFNWFDDLWYYSNNQAGRNNLSLLPPALQYLPQLSELICGGDQNNSWQISDMTAVGQLEQLTYLDLSHNKIEVLASVEGMANLTLLLLPFNKIKKIDSQFPDRLAVLDLRYNLLEDITGLIPLLKRGQYPMKLSVQAPGSKSDDFVAVTGNPFVTEYAEVFRQGDKAILEFVDAQAALSQTAGEAREPVWRQIHIVCTDDEADDAIQLHFSIPSNTQHPGQEATMFVARKVIDGLIDPINIRSWTAMTAKRLRDLLIPASIMDQFDGRYHLILELDAAAALYPWEYIDSQGSLSVPLCFQVKIVRQPMVRLYRAEPLEQGSNKALIIGNPLTEGFAPALPIAEQEAATATDILRNAGLTTKLMNGQPAEEIISSLFSGGYRVLHIAAHGTWQSHPDGPVGVVIGNNMFLKGSDFRELATMPELVFLNCDYIGRTGLAEELLQYGVKAVLVPRDFLDDRQAEAFSTAFYKCMAEGMQFAEAAMQARRATITPDSMDYFPATYQCYGDPFYRLVDRPGTTGTSAAMEEKKETGHQRSLLVAWLMNTSRQTIGTGFLVTRNMLGVDVEDELLLMTCWHVVAGEPGQPATPGPTDFIARFDVLNEKETFSLTEVVWASGANDLDVALLRFEKSSHDRLLALTQELTFYPVAEKLPDLTESPPPEIFIIGYPEGQALKIIDENCVLLDRSDRLLHYSRVTRPGSAGSAVFNANWELIGLHHAGSDTMKTLNETGVYAASEGISIHAIIEQVKEALGAREVGGIRTIRTLLICSPTLTPVMQRFDASLAPINDLLLKQRFHLEKISIEEIPGPSDPSSDPTAFLRSIDICVIVFQDVSELKRDYMQLASMRYQLSGKPKTLAFRMVSKGKPRRMGARIDSIEIGVSHFEVSNIDDLLDIFVETLLDLSIFKNIALDASPSKPKKKVFLAATYSDLKEYRSSLINFFAGMPENFELINLESYSFNSMPVVGRSLTDLELSDIMILLVADKYGFIPYGNDHRSLTEMQFDAAIELNKPVLAFFVAETNSKDDLYSNREKLANFKRKVSDTVLVHEVRSPQELASSLSSALWEIENKKNLLP